MSAITEPRRTVLLGHIRTAITVSCAAVPGTTVQSSSAQPRAPISSPAAAVTPADFGSGERSLPAS